MVKDIYKIQNIAIQYNVNRNVISKINKGVHYLCKVYPIR